MDTTGKLHEMCNSTLAATDIKAICKVRGLPSQAATSRSLLESLFLSDTGVAAAFQTLDKHEISLFHLLAAIDEPVDVSFFERMYPAKGDRRYYSTYTQQYQNVFSKVKERLIRRGLLVVWLVRDCGTKRAKMERWRFAVPTQFSSHLPPLLDSARSLSGDGDVRPSVARERLAKAIKSPDGDGVKEDRLAIVDGQLCFGDKPFSAEHLRAWQTRHWQQELKEPKSTHERSDPHSLPTAEAAARILAGLASGLWCDVDEFAAPLKIFSGAKTDGKKICEVGWRLGLLARQQADGKLWYRLASPPLATDAPPHRYLDTTSDGNITVDLETVPLESLEQIVAISQQRAGPGGRAVLLITPDTVKLGRAVDEVLDSPLLAWLRKNSRAFRQTLEMLDDRRGKTVLHENLSVARVTDLTLKVAIEKALGSDVVQMGKEHLAFPYDRVADVERVVTKSGHVVKEVTHRGT